MARPESLEKRKYLHRILLVALCQSLFFGLILGRMYYLQHVRHDYYEQRSRSNHTKTVKITPQRGTIFGARDTPLASSSFRETAYLAPGYIEDDPHTRKRLCRELAHTLDLPLETVERKMTSG
ncbi:hypothetical protein HQ520_18145, partial [bacterium]|nr:hypothetical protein [bacterium]